MNYLIWFVFGGLGGVCRYLVDAGISKLWSKGFPLATLVINVVGGFIIGVFAGIEVVPVWAGGFTTLSKYNLELFELLEQKNWRKAALYFGLTVVVPLLACVVGVVSKTVF
jgi:CrcB protein